MKLAALFLAILLAFAGDANAGGIFTRIEGQGIHAPSADTDPCPPSALTQNHDGSTEGAFTWGWPGVLEPDYGALAEGYPSLAPGTVCGVELYLSRWGSMNGIGAIDLFVWDFDTGTGNPGAVLSATPSVPISGVSFWPSVSIHDLDAQDAVVPPQGVFVGYWPRSFVEAPEQFGCAYDRDGPGGVPRTKIVPGGPWPSGWQNPTVVGFNIVAWGIGPWVQPDVIPVQETSWGAVKALHHRD